MGDRMSDIKVEVAAGTVIRPDDSLVVSVGNARLTAEQADGIRSALLAELPDLANVVIIVGVANVAVGRPEVG